MILSVSVTTWLVTMVSTGDETQIKPRCVGYTVIEVDKGIDCNGDTIRITKRNGFYEIAANR